MKIRHLTPNRYNSVPPMIANPYSPQKLSAEELGSVRGAKESRYAADFIELKEIGRGGFGSVFECRHVVDGWVYAVKRSIRQLRGQSELRQGLKEVFALASLPAHPNVVRYYSSWLEDEHLFIQTELCSGGSLSDLMGTLDEAVLLDYLRSAASGIAHIHMHDLVHMDIKPDNIYLTAERVVKIGDFGLSDRSTSMAEFEDGDGKYLAPELLEESPPSLKKADMFALGATFLELARGRPLPSRGDRWHEIRDGKFELPGFSDEFVELLKEMMNPLPEKRPTALGLLLKPILATSEASALALLEGQRVVNSRLVKELEDMKRVVQAMKNQVLGAVAV